MSFKTERILQRKKIPSVYVAPDGNNKKSPACKLKEAAIEWGDKIRTGSLEKMTT